MALTQMDKLDREPNLVWTTYSSHPFSGLQVQEADGEYGRWARVTHAGYEVVGPWQDIDHVHRQYTSRVQRYINDES